MNRRTPGLLAAAILAIAALFPAVAPAATAKKLNGTFLFSPGKFKKGKAGGTYFRMIQPGGTVKRGPFFANPNSRAKDKTYTLLKAGIDGGLWSGRFQDPPDPAFAPNGFALANRIMTPTLFAGIRFSLSTAATDAQSGRKVGVPVIRAKGRKLTGDVRGFTASWNSIWFNQGAPKPAGNLPGRTRKVSGTYDPRTRRYTITWVSQIVGGPFNDFSGYWHLQGKFRPGKYGKAG
ncbi:MAG: hypothetical protein JW895_08950 [Thermoleophilaceae bacterium]|nr:hypothetical protein [Thermoleophilaceae bacterium]